MDNFLSIINMLCRAPEIINFKWVQPSDDVIDEKTPQQNNIVTKTNNKAISLFQRPEQASHMHYRMLRVEQSIIPCHFEEKILAKPIVSQTLKCS